jgi:hypothetical protein
MFFEFNALTISTIYFNRDLGMPSRSLNRRDTNTAIPTNNGGIGGKKIANIL